MKNSTANTHTAFLSFTSSSFKLVHLFLLLLALTSCGGGDDDSLPKDKLNESNLEFVSKAKAISFSGIELYEGHVSLDNVNKVDLNVQNLESGELISVEIDFELLDELDDYSLTVQLVPESILNDLGQGDTLGELTRGNAATLKLDGVVTLGSVYIDQIQSGQMNAIIQAKLPTLGEEQKYKVVVTPTLHYLSSGESFTESDANIVPVFIDDRTLDINKLDKIKVEIVNLPDLEEDNEFTRLESGGKFDAEGYSIDPVFQTSIKLDVTTFNKSEDVSLLLTWTHPVSGLSFPVGLLSSDANGDPVISDNARFTIQAGDATFVTLPVVAYAPVKTQTALLKQATNIKDIADQNAVNGEFSLEVFYDDGGSDISAGSAYNLSIPLVSQANRVMINSAEEVIGFTVFRAGSLNNACLIASGLDVDSGLFANDSVNAITAVTCQEIARANMLWRYDVATKHIISKVADEDGNSYCIAIFSSNGLVNNDYHLEKCEFAGTFELPVSRQRFNFEGNKIKSERVTGYLGVIFSSLPEKEVQVQSEAIAPEFFTDFNGVDLDSDGRLFHVAEFVDRTWGDKDTAAVTLSYGGETFADYLPVIGTTTQGHVTFSAFLLGKSADIFDARFTIKKHLAKKLSFTGINSPGVEVENGAKLDIEVINGFKAVHRGELTKSTITETYLASDAADEIFADVDIEEPIIIEPLPDTEMDVEFLNVRFTVVVIPIQITGGITGDVSFDVKLTTPGIGLDVDVGETFLLSGYLKARADIPGASATLNATIDVLEQNISFIAKGGFTPEILPNVNIHFDLESSLINTLKVLRGTVAVEYEYDYWLSSGEGDYIIYQSGYLFNDTWTLYDEPISASGITY